MNRVAAFIAAASFLSAPAFAGTYTYRDDAEFATLFPQFLGVIPEGGLIMCHPGRVDAELERLDPLTTLREREYDYFLSETFPRDLAAHGVALEHDPEKWNPVFGKGLSRT